MRVCITFAPFLVPDRPLNMALFALGHYPAFELVVLALRLQLLADAAWFVPNSLRKNTIAMDAFVL